MWTTDMPAFAGSIMSSPTPTPSLSPSPPVLGPISQGTHDFALILALLLAGLAVGIVISFIWQGWSTKRRPLLAIP